MAAPPTSGSNNGTPILILGILSIVCIPILGPVALIMGYSAMKKAPPGQAGLAQGGMICGIIGTLLILPMLAIYAAILFPVFAKARDKAREEASTANLHQIGMGVVLYAADNNNKLPPTDSYDHLETALLPYVKSKQPFSDPESDQGTAPYAIVTDLTNKHSADFSDPDSVVVLESSSEHFGGRVFLYLDGAVRWQRDPDSQGSSASPSSNSP